MAPGSRGRQLLLEWPDSDEEAPRQENNIFIRFLSRFMFVLLSERRVEARHSVSNRVLTGARHGGVVHLASTVLFQYIEDELREADALQEYNILCAGVKNPLLIIESVGLAWRPRVTELLRRLGSRWGGLNRHHRKDLIRVIFHVDSYTLYRPAGFVDSSLPPPPPPPPGFRDLEEAAFAVDSEPTPPAIDSPEPHDPEGAQDDGLPPLPPPPSDPLTPADHQDDDIWATSHVQRQTKHHSQETCPQE